MKYMVVLYILLLVLLWIFGWGIKIEREKYEISRDAMQQKEVTIDSLQSIVDNCDSRVNDMRLQRDHAIETNRWGEMQRVKP